MNKHFTQAYIYSALNKNNKTILNFVQTNSANNHEHQKQF